MFRISGSFMYRNFIDARRNRPQTALAAAFAATLFLSACGSSDKAPPRAEPNAQQVERYMDELGWFDFGPDPKMAGESIETPTQTAPVEYAAVPDVGGNFRSADSGAAIAASESHEAVAALEFIDEWPGENGAAQSNRVSAYRGDTANMRGQQGQQGGEIAGLQPDRVQADGPEPGAGGYYAGDRSSSPFDPYGGNVVGRVAPAYQQPSYLSLPTFAGRPSNGGKAKIAILVPLSGPHRGVGEALLHAAEMALFSMGADDLELLPRDTKGTPDGAAQAAHDAVQSGAELIIGPLFASSVAAVAPVARQAQITVLAFSNDRSVASPGVFLLGFLPEQQVARIVRFAHRKGLRRFAALFPQTAYGERVERAFNLAVSDIGSQVVTTASYEPIPEAMFDPVRRLAAYDQRTNALEAERAALQQQGDAFSQAAMNRLAGHEAIGSAGFDAVLLPEGGNNLRSLAPLLPYYDIDPKEVRFLGTGLWGEPGLGLEPSLQGGWYAGPPPDVGEAFNARYKALYGNQPPRLVTMAFDAIALTATLAKAGGPYRFAPRAFVRPEGFAGLDGIFRLHRDGLNERGLAIVEVLPRGVRIIDPAPTEFGGYDARWQQEMVNERGLTRYPQYEAIN
ncbi:MAG: penicillin-binding protein activator [Alphaproteobacteria bacterium]